MKRIYEINDTKEEMPWITETPQIHSVILFDEKPYVVNLVIYDTINSLVRVQVVAVAFR